MKKPILCLMGPTASGKTALAIELVQHFPLEIISVDSGMVYQGMDIGTAKPTPTELQKAPHHLINLCDPATPYSAGNFRRDALIKIKEIQDRGNIPLLVGGTMLYFHVLQYGVAKLPGADNLIREKLTEEAKKIGWYGMHEKLKIIDPKAATELHPNDRQRIQRALEVYKITGQTMTDLQILNIENPATYSFINIIIEPTVRKYLHDRIAQRFSLMLSQGFLEEVESLKKRPELHSELPSMRSVGYRQAWSYLEGEYDQDTFQERAIIATRQLAKRQLTWCRRWENASRFYMEEQNLFSQISVIARSTVTK